MALTALVWNIERFGDKFNASNMPVYMETLRCLLISDVVSAAGANVLVIQELREPGVAFLRVLARDLGLATGAVWHYDWIRGSLTSAVYPATQFGQLNFTQTGNNEGYAVLWSAGSLERFNASTLSAGIDTPDPSAMGLAPGRDRFLGMVFGGRPLQFNNVQYDITYDAAGAIGPLGFPQSICPAKGSVYHLRSGAITSSNASIQQQLKVRRPVCVKLRVTGTRTVPLIVFHAPVGQRNSRSQVYGTMIGFAAEQLQVNDCVYAGDFNVIGNAKQAMLAAYPATLAPAYVASSYTGGLPVRSVVHIRDDNDDFRTGNGVFGSARDYGFARAAAAAPTLTIRNVLDDDIIAVNGDVRATLDDNLDDVDDIVLPDIIRQQGADAAGVVVDFLDNQPIGHGADNRTAAAIIYRCLISDHLPIQIVYT